VVMHLSLANWLTMVVVTQHMRKFLLGTYRNLELVLFITFLVCLLESQSFFNLWIILLGGLIGSR
jgi:quinol-cytochrome oxidoreductase complex cytochrome b subunit